MKKETKQLIINIAIPLLVGAVAGFVTRGGMEAFNNLNKPPLSPPAWLFPIVWTILYILMGVGAFLIGKQGKNREDVQSALATYGLQLFFNFVWPIIFFNLKWYILAFGWLAVMWVLIVRMILKYYPIDKNAAYLMFPYLLWTSFAGYLNLAIYFLN